jgi:hypothetical protein
MDMYGGMYDMDMYGGMPGGMSVVISGMVIPGPSDP